MDNFAENLKITKDHLRRNAYLYIRQSTLKQVFENTESGKRQYGLQDRISGLGWAREQIIVIDNDLGQSGSSAEGREGFKRLVSEVGIGSAGIVAGLEVSRLARNSTDWHRLLEICALTKTLILDEDGIYDPAHFNDRLLLGLKGTMSEAELYMIRARLVGGMQAKAKRGELKLQLPVGFRYNSIQKVIRDPDKQVQNSISLFFKTFSRLGSASATVKYFRENKLKFPKKILGGISKGEIVWGNLTHNRSLQLLHNPRYAGAFVYGRLTTRNIVDGKRTIKKLPRENWHTLIKDSHEGYITWEEYEKNIKILETNAQARSEERDKTPAREGPALLQGIVICGICGSPMTIRYHVRNGKRIPDYVCQRKRIENYDKVCQHIPGGTIDIAIGELLVNSMTPLALDVALKVQEEVKNRVFEADKLRRQHVERVKYEADLARRRYMATDPENRLVAETLEADWNEKLVLFKQAQEEYEKTKKEELLLVNDEEKIKLLSLSADFSKLWLNPNTPDKEKKRMVRLLIEDVTLIKNNEIIVKIRFKGGKTKIIKLPPLLNATELRRTNKDVILRIDELLNKHTDKEIVGILNDEGFLSGERKKFTSRIVQKIRRTYGLKNLHERLKEKKLLTVDEIASKLKVHKCTIKKWASIDLINAYKYNDKNEKLYEWPGEKLIDYLKKDKLMGRGVKFIDLTIKRINEVQYEV